MPDTNQKYRVQVTGNGVAIDQLHNASVIGALLSSLPVTSGNAGPDGAKPIDGYRLRWNPAANQGWIEIRVLKETPISGGWGEIIKVAADSAVEMQLMLHILRNEKNARWDGTNLVAGESELPVIQ